MNISNQISNKNRTYCKTPNYQSLSNNSCPTKVLGDIQPEYFKDDWETSVTHTSQKAPMMEKVVPQNLRNMSHKGRLPFVCVTRPNVEETELIWNISDFLELRRMASFQALDSKLVNAGSTEGNVIYSPPSITSLSSSQQLKWRVALFPNGTKESRGHCSVYIHIMGYESSTISNQSSIRTNSENNRVTSLSTTTSEGNGNGYLCNEHSVKSKGRIRVKHKMNEWIKKTAIRKSPRPENWPKTLRSGYDQKEDSNEEFKLKTFSMRSPKRLCMQYSIELLDMEGSPVPETKVEQIIKAFSQESYWGFPKYLTVLSEEDLMRFVNALGGCLRLHVCVRIWDGTSTRSNGRNTEIGIPPIPTMDILQPKGLTKTKELDTVNNPFEDSEHVQFFESMKRNLLKMPEIFFDIEIQVGATARLRANRLIVASRCPVLSQVLNILTLPAKYQINGQQFCQSPSTVYWPKSQTDDVDVIGCLLQWIHFDSCDLTRPELSGPDHEQRLMKLCEISKQLELNELELECRSHLASIRSRHMGQHDVKCG